MNKKEYVLAVAALVWNQSGRLLLLRRALDSRYFAGEWEPPGGKLDAGEEIGVAVRREAREEANLDINLDAVAGVSEVKLSGRCVVVLYFNAHPVSGAPSISKEHCDFRWVAREELKAMNLTQVFRRFVARHGFEGSAAS